MNAPIAFPVGSAVLVNGETPGTVIEATPMPGTFTTFNRPFVSYLVKLDSGAVEGFTGDYLSVVPTRKIDVPAGTPILVTWLFGDEAYGRVDASYTAVLNGVDGMGTATFTRDEDGFIGVAGSPAWRPL
jgi:hypothetical protein